jgi:hypothetical protein
MSTFGKLLHRITVPTGGWDATVGPTETATIPAGTYYLPALLDEVADKFATAAGETCTVTAATGEGGTGKVTITFGAATAVTWVDTDLRDILGFDDDLLSDASHVSPGSARSVWLPTCPFLTLNSGKDSRWRGHRDGDFRHAMNMSGHVWARHGQHHVRLEPLRWQAVRRDRIWIANESVTGQSFEQFWLDGVWGEAAWGSPGGPIRWYPDADNDGVWGTYRAIDAMTFLPGQLQESWAGMWGVTMPPMIQVPGDITLGLPPSANFSWAQDDDATALTLVAASSQRASITDAAQTGLDFVDEFTIAGWFYYDGNPSDTVSPLAKWTGTTAGDAYLWQDRETTENAFKFFVKDKGVASQPSVSVAVPPRNQWVYIAQTFNLANAGSLLSAQLKVYYDAELQTPTGSSTRITALNDEATGDFLLGGAFSQHHEGKLFCFRIWSAELTQEELRAEMCSLTPVRTDGLQASWKLQSDYQDDSPNANHLTPLNSPTFEDVLAVQLTDTTPDPDSMITDQEWTADGKSFRGAAPYLLVDAAGDYPTQLTVTKQGGSQSSKTKTVRVEGPNGVPTDGPDDWYLPTEAAHFTALGLAAPDYYVLCDAASGDLTPVIDDGPYGDMIAQDTGHLYEQAVTGWAAKTVGLAEGDSGSWRVTAGVALGESFAVLAYAAVSQTSGTRQILCALGTTNRLALNTGPLRTVHNSVAADGAIDVRDLDTVRQLVWYRNATANASGTRSNLEDIPGTHDEGVDSAEQSSIGPTTGSAAALRFLIFGVFKGANAEQDWDAYLTTLRGD